MVSTSSFLLSALVAGTAMAADQPLNYTEYMALSPEAPLFQPLILSGTEVPKGTERFVTGVSYTNGGSYVCGGSLVAPNYVLSAAHCAAYSNYVTVGSHYMDGSGGQRFRVKRKNVHPNYSTSGNSFDYMLLELDGSSTIEPVKLAAANDRDIRPGEDATVMGWGATSEGGSSSSVLLGVDVEVLTNEECSRRLQIDQTMVCAGGVSNEDSCQGDSGGPLVNSDDVQIGVVSWGYGCGRRGYPGVYSRISYVRDWIDGIIN